MPVRFWNGGRDGERHPRVLHTSPTLSHMPGGGGRLLWAAARPVMRIYFPQLCALVPSLSSSAPCSRVNERLRNEAVPCMGTPGTCPLGCQGLSTPGPKPRQCVSNLPPPFTPTCAPCQSPQPAPGAQSLGLTASDLITNALIAKKGGGRATGKAGLLSTERWLLSFSPAWEALHRKDADPENNTIQYHATRKPPSA